MHEDPDMPLVPVIVLMYGRDRGVLYRMAPFKIDDYQIKPLRPKRLAERIRAIARQRLFCNRILQAVCDGDDGHLAKQVETALLSNGSKQGMQFGGGAS